MRSSIWMARWYVSSLSSQKVPLVQNAESEFRQLLLLLFDFCLSERSSERIEPLSPKKSSVHSTKSSLSSSIARETNTTYLYPIETESIKIKDRNCIFALYLHI